jgi:lathosterol oxidase
MNLIDMNSILPDWWLIILIVFGFALSRYFLLAGLAWLFCYYPGLKHLKCFKIQSRFPQSRQLRHELIYSLSTICIFSAVGLVVYYLFINGYTTLYINRNQHSWPYLFLSLALMVVVHDGYFYWTHRLLHTRWFLKKVHVVHHRSTNPTPWAAYSFHPLEALIQGLIVFPFVTIFPVHVFVFLFFTFLVLLMNVMGHLGFEFIPKKIRNSRVGARFTSSTHHNQHHQRGNRNFGYYFTFWDRTMGTSHN